ncbi:tail fiber protein [Synechococcus phage S-SM2]|uniref:Phage tail fiber-like protein n=1 Tax=Synechococcus phage S-SM2 TaxID=444860 RepID=E3SIS8_9CAUD|nr:tail fiber protein [Synechococcus phage S-SM2]ADO97376.1 phage tail fiber-like protein [Synechococcus phage S-SM2]
MGAQGYIGRSPGDSSNIIARQTYTPTGITTDFTFASTYSVGYIDVYLNGVRLVEGNDFTATDGSVVGLTTHAQNGDIIELVAYKAFNATNVTAANNNFSVGGNLSVTGVSTFTGAITATGGITGAVTGDATGLTGTPDITIRNLTGVAATFTGVLSYDDVTNVDSVGYATFRSGINVQGAGSTTTTLNVSGVTTMTGDANFGSVLNIDDSIVHSGDSNTKIRFPAADTFTVETGGSERLRVTSAGNLGIGTVDPASDLQVASYGDHGKIRVESSGDGNRAGVEFFRESSAGTGKGAAGIWVESETGNSSGELRFGTASNASLQSFQTRMILDSSGDLGIGTDNPSAKLHVENNAANATIARFESNMGTNNNRGISIKSPVSDSASEPFIFDTGNAYQFQCDSTSALHINFDRNIGINTDNPLQKLHLVDDTSANIYLQTHNTSIGSSAGVYFRTSNSSTQDGFFKSAIVLEDDGTSHARGKLHILQDNTADSSNATLVDSVVTITQSGSVGIGTTVPQEQLHIFGTSDFVVDTDSATLRFGSYGEHDIALVTGRNTSAGSSRLYIENGDGEALRIDSNGQIGIGTDDPQQFVHIHDEGNSGIVTTRIQQVSSNTPTDGGAFLQLGGTRSNGTFGHYGGIFGGRRNQAGDNTGYLALHVDNNDGASMSERVRITHQGRIGIGTESPDGFLVIQGNSNDSTVPSIRLQDGTDARQVSITNNSGDFVVATHGVDNSHHGQIKIFEGGQISLLNGGASGSLTERLRIATDGSVTKPTNPLFKSNMGAVYGSGGSLITSPSTAILQSAAEIDVGNTSWTTSGSNAYTFVCPVAGVYAVHAHMSLDDISEGNRVIFVIGYTAGGGNLPLSSYVEVMDTNVHDYQNYSYYNTWNFSAGTRIGFGINSGSGGTLSGFNSQWGIHLLQ